MRIFKRLLTVAISCVLMICMLAFFAACKADEKEEGGRLSKNSKLIGSWHCYIPNYVKSQNGVMQLIKRPEKYKSTYQDEFYITIEYKEHVGGYSMKKWHWWWDLETGSRYSTEGSDVLLIEYQDIKLEDNQYFYKGYFDTYCEHSGYIFNYIDNSDNDRSDEIKAVNIVDSSKSLLFVRTVAPVDDYIEMHSQTQLPEYWEYQN